MVRPSGNEGLILLVRYKLTVIPVTRVTGNSVCLKMRPSTKRAKGALTVRNGERSSGRSYIGFTLTLHTHTYIIAYLEKRNITTRQTDTHNRLLDWGADEHRLVSGRIGGMGTGLDTLPVTPAVALRYIVIGWTAGTGIVKKGNATQDHNLFDPRNLNSVLKLFRIIASDRQDRTNRFI